MPLPMPLSSQTYPVIVMTWSARTSPNRLSPISPPRLATSVRRVVSSTTVMAGSPGMAIVDTYPEGSTSVTVYVPALSIKKVNCPHSLVTNSRGGSPPASVSSTVTPPIPDSPASRVPLAFWSSNTVPKSAVLRGLLSSPKLTTYSSPSVSTCTVTVLGVVEWYPSGSVSATST